MAKNIVDLPPELWEVLLQKATSHCHFTSLRHVICLSVVCKAWKSAVRRMHSLDISEYKEKGALRFIKLTMDKQQLQTIEAIRINNGRWSCMFLLHLLTSHFSIGKIPYSNETTVPQSPAHRCTIHSK